MVDADDLLASGESASIGIVVMQISVHLSDDIAFVAFAKIGALAVYPEGGDGGGREKGSDENGGKLEVHGCCSLGLEVRIVVLAVELKAPVCSGRVKVGAEGQLMISSWSKKV